MTHFGLVCPSATGHLNTMTALGFELKKRGHRVTLIGMLDSQQKTLAAGLNFQAIGESEFPKGSIQQLHTRLGESSGLSALQLTLDWLKKEAVTFLQYAPKAIQEIGIEVLLVDQVSPAGVAVAMSLNIPFINVCSALIANQDDSIPPFFTSWSYSKSKLSKLRNKATYAFLNRLARPIRKILDEYARNSNISIPSSAEEGYSKLVKISQQPVEFEFPRTNLPDCFHFVGSINNPASREVVSFPWEKLTGQPLIYASMGTIVSKRADIFQKIALACEDLDAQLVISLGGSATPESLPRLPGSPLVVSYAPQLELLQKASLTITHAGLNTTLESLSNGVPLVAIPIVNDEPGVAARIAWTGTGEFVAPNKLSVPRLRKAIDRVLKDRSYKQNAIRLQQAIERAGGASRAADIIEQAISEKNN